MKNTIISYAAAALLLAGCNEADFLNTTPQGVINDKAIDIEMLATSAYAALGGPQGQSWSVWLTPTTNWSYGDVRSDNALKGGGSVGDCGEIHRIETCDVDATVGNLDAKWYHLYCSVQRCNSALKLLNAVSEQEFPARRSRIGEMKMLRAHYYFELSRLYNKIPYFDEHVEIDDYPKISNDVYTRDQILGMIADELDAAAGLLPERQDEIGRVDRYAAWAYEAKVKLYRAYKQDEETHAVTEIDRKLLGEVVVLCDKVLDNPRFDLLQDFQQLDLVEYENGCESIFTVQYSMNDGTVDAGRINWSNLLNAPPIPYNGDGFFLPSQNLINAYQTDAEGLPLFDTFDAHDYDIIEFDIAGKAVNTQVESNVDPRLDFVVGRPNIRWKTYTDRPCQASWVRDAGTYGYHCSKRHFVSPESKDLYGGWPWGASQLNWRIIRTADVMLWKAEALIEQNVDLGTARELINAIRERARGSAWVRDFDDPEKYAAHYKIESYPAVGWTQEYARKALRFESRLEKAMEGERFFDLVRWGIADEVMNRYFETEKKHRVYYGNSSFRSGRDEYFPISNAQYNFSEGRYVQNPGYGTFR